MLMNSQKIAFMRQVMGSLPRPVYTSQSDAHVRLRHIENIAPRFQNKTKFKPGEGGGAFADEIYHPNVVVYQHFADSYFAHSPPVISAHRL